MLPQRLFHLLVLAWQVNNFEGEYQVICISVDMWKKTNEQLNFPHSDETSAPPYTVEERRNAVKDMYSFFCWCGAGGCSSSCQCVETTGPCVCVCVWLCVCVFVCLCALPWVIHCRHRQSIMLNYNLSEKPATHSQLLCVHFTHTLCACVGFFACAYSSVCVYTLCVCVSHLLHTDMNSVWLGMQIKRL